MLPRPLSSRVPPHVRWADSRILSLHCTGHVPPPTPKRFLLPALGSTLVGAAGQYSVAVYPPKAVAFQPDGGGGTILQQTAVVIGTAYPPGPRPTVYSPPAYDDASSRASEFRIFR